MSDELSYDPALPAGPLERVIPVRRERSKWRQLGAVFFAALLLYTAATAVRIYVRHYYVFLPDYVRWAVTPAPVVDEPVHVFFLFTDHFEPRYDPVPKIERWTRKYMKFAARHRDSEGRVPQHTWFYPGEQPDAGAFAAIQHLTRSGLGELELHFHHSGDTSATLRPKLEAAIQTLQRFGFLKTVDGQTRFGFLHGNFALDNGDGEDHSDLCGVDDELQLLRRVGAYADFTFPDVYEAAQPPFVNSIYAAKDDPMPRSYRRWHPLEDLRTGQADLLMFEGPTVFAPTLTLRRLFLDLDDGNIHAAMPSSPARVDRWIKADVHVPNRPDWIFVKVFAHSISTPEDESDLFDGNFDSAMDYLETRYNDGKKYVLHYVTAREAYNLVMAAVDRRTGDPRQYYDYIVKRYEADGEPAHAVGQPPSARDDPRK